MTIQKQAEQLAANLGTKIEVNYSSYDQSYDLQVPAPDGKQWTDGNCLNMLETYYSYIKGGKNEAYKMLITRMNSGLEDITAINEY